MVAQPRHRVSKKFEVGRVPLVLAARISRINVTPVKSFRLDHPDAVRLEQHGVAEDRRFLLVDQGLRLYHGNRDSQLVRANARWDPESRRLAIAVPGDRPLEDRVVRGERIVVDVYGRRIRGHVVQGPWASALSELVGRPLVLVERLDGHWATDIRPVTIISQASLDLIDGDGRRFRTMLELDGLHPLEEEVWRGRRVRAGGATLLIGAPTPRCRVPSASPETGRRDRDVLRELLEVRREAENATACLGVYAEVLTPGVVRVGDAVEPLEEHPFAAKVLDRLKISSRRLVGSSPKGLRLGIPTRDRSLRQQP
jgi:uncharacterized protein YcbX